MKKCNNCGRDLPDNVVFCPECGTKTEQIVNTNTNANTPPQSMQPPPETRPIATPPPPQPREVSSGNIDPSLFGKATYLGAGLVILSSFLPLVSVLGGLGSFSVSEISGIVTAAIIAFAAIALYFQAQGQVDLMPIIGTGLLLLLVVGVVEYNSAMDEVSKFLGSGGKAAAKAAFSFSAGFYAFTGGSILMCIGGSGCLAHQTGLALNFSGILSGWKEALLRTVVLGSLQIPGWVVSIVVTGILGLLIKNIKF